MLLKGTEHICEINVNFIQKRRRQTVQFNSSWLIEFLIKINVPVQQQHWFLAQIKE